MKQTHIRKLFKKITQIEASEEYITDQAEKLLLAIGDSLISKILSRCIMLYALPKTTISYEDVALVLQLYFFREMDEEIDTYFDNHSCIPVSVIKSYNKDLSDKAAILIRNVVEYIIAEIIYSTSVDLPITHTSIKKTIQADKHIRDFFIKTNIHILPRYIGGNLFIPQKYLQLKHYVDDEVFLNLAEYLNVPLHKDAIVIIREYIHEIIFNITTHIEHRNMLNKSKKPINVINAIYVLYGDNVLKSSEYIRLCHKQEMIPERDCLHISGTEFRREFLRYYQSNSNVDASGSQLKLLRLYIEDRVMEFLLKGKQVADHFNANQVLQTHLRLVSKLEN